VISSESTHFYSLSQIKFLIF